jgi:T5orf172 domain
MRFVIGLISFFAILFSAPRWGWEGVITVFVVAFLADWLWNDHQRTLKAERKEKDQKRRDDADREKLRSFYASGCNFHGNKENIWEFEHRFDLARSRLAKGLLDLKQVQFRVLKTTHGYVLAFCRAGWPESITEWAAIDILKIASEGRVADDNRPIVHFATSEAAINEDERRRREHLEEIQQRVLQRTADLKARTASDMGSEATAVYVITTNARNSSKVGISDNPDRRKANLQTGNAQQLNVHAQFWMKNRQHALFLEQSCHRIMKRKGHVRIGEWFSVEPEIASRHVVDTYIELVEQRVLIEDDVNASEESTDEELRQQILIHLRWRRSKQGNYVVNFLGRKITVFRR